VQRAEEDAHASRRRRGGRSSREIRTKAYTVYSCIEEKAGELWKEGGNAKGREGEGRSLTST